MLTPVVVLAEEGLPDGWISFDGVTAAPTAPRVQIISTSSSQIQLIISTPGMLCETIEHDGTDYKRLSFPEYFHTHETGYPALPALRQLLAVPRGCDVDVSVASSDTLVFSDCIVYPVEEIVTRYTDEGWPYLDTEFSKDSQAYSRGGNYPDSTASAESGGSFRGQGVLPMALYPVRFDASKSEIYACPDMLVTIELTGGSGSFSEDVGPFGGIAERLLLCYAGKGHIALRGPAGDGDWGVQTSVAACEELKTDYLMIVEGSLMECPALERLAQHRASYDGFNVAIVSDATVISHHGQGEISDEAIKNFIQSLYETGSAEHVGDGKLAYVLLVGDAQDADHGGTNSLIPAHEETLQGTSTGSTTDHWYACVYGATDWYPDLMIGRLCASDTTEFRREVQKFVGYEEDANSSDPWRTNILLTDGFCVEDESVHDAFDAAQEVIPGGYEVEEVHALDWSGITCQAQRDSVRAVHRNRINDTEQGLFALELCAHGHIHMCYSFRREDVAELTNTGGQLPFWMSHSCLTGAYDMYEPVTDPYDCLGEVLMHQHEIAGEPTGALAFFGPSETTIAPWGGIGAYVWEGLFDGSEHQIGGFLTYAKMKHISRTGSFAHALKFNLLGDPAIDIMLTDTGGDGYSSAPDYAVRELGLSVDPLYPSIGQTVTFRAEIENNSNYNPGGAVRVYFEICDADSSSPTLVDSMDIQPAAWDTATAWGSWLIPVELGAMSEIGHRLLRVTVVPQADPDELRTDNNVAALSFGIGFEDNDPPHKLWGTEGLSITVADVDGSLPKGILASVRIPGKVIVYSAAGESLYCFEAPNQAALRGPPAVADLNADGTPEIVICYGDYVDAIDGATGNDFWTEPCYVEGLDSVPVIGDFIGGDAGSLEVIVRSVILGGGTQPGSGESLVAIDSDGNDVWSTEPAANAQLTWRESSAACVDLDLDGLPDVVWGISCGGSDTLKAVSGHDGRPLWAAGVEGGMGCQLCNPVVAELVSDSAGPEIICGGQSLAAFTADGRTTGSERSVAGYVTGIALADIDGSRPPEIIVVSAGTDDVPAAVCGKLYLFEWSAGEFACIDSVALEYQPFAQPVIADLDGDGSIGIIVSSWQEHWIDWMELVRRDMTHVDIYTVTAGTSLERFPDIGRPLFFWGSPASTPAVVDADQDGHLEIWFADGEGMLHCLEWEAITGSGALWPAYQRDARHTGVYETAISGAYPANTDASWWGDYLLTGDVTIDATSSLLVQSGTTVRVASDDDQSGGADTTLTELIIHGDIAASGDGVFAPTIFASAASEPSPDSWYGIRVCQDGTGEIDGCTVKDAFIGITATEPDVLTVENCVIEGCDAAGIKCTGPVVGTSDILIFQNLISDAETGIDLERCNATVDTNTITYCGSYGISATSDRGSEITRNVISFPFYASGGPFAGIRLNVLSGEVHVTNNSITNARSSGITCGVQSSLGTEVYVTDNTILDQQASTTSKGMYFYQSEAIPRHNRIVEKRDGFWIEAATQFGENPNLGITMGDGGYNSVNGTWLRYGVRADPYCLTTVMAEANWWGTANPSERLFMGLVDWHPFLVTDPFEPRGSGDGDGAEETIPFCLIQNSPNPFNPVTSLRFGLPEQQHVSLSIYDVAGRCVRTLLDGTVEPGWHDVVWDGRDDAQHRVSSGVYFCRLISQDSTSVKKVVLLK